MKIVNIELIQGIYHVARKPNRLQKFFNIKSRVDRYKDTGYTYAFGGGTIYRDQKGVDLGNIIGYGSNTREAIDRWRRSF